MEPLERLTLTTPKHGGNKTTWGKRKWKEVDLKATTASALSEYISSHSSWLSFYTAECSTQGLNLASRVPLPSSPQSRASSSYCCWLWAAGRAPFFSHYIFSSLTSSVISRVCALSSARNKAVLWQLSQKEALTFRLQSLGFLLLASWWPTCLLCANTVWNPGDILFSVISWLKRVIPKKLNRIPLFCSVMANHGVVSTPVALKCNIHFAILKFNSQTL